jgi:hypothetical protein
VPKQWNGSSFGVYVNISENPHPDSWSPFDADSYAITLSSGTAQTSAPTSDTSNFVIEGKWKQVGSDTHGQMQQGAIVIFNGANCNVWSPQDTYAFYKDGGKHRLDVTGLLFANKMSYWVTVTDRNNINLTPGPDSDYNTGNFSVHLMRVG